MEKKWITTEQMLEKLKNAPNDTQQYTHYLGGMLRSTHWLSYSPERNQFADSLDWFHDSWYTEAEFLDAYAGHWWMKDH